MITANQWQRMHWSKRRKFQQALAWEVRILLKGRIPAAPLRRARMTITRYSRGVPDHDGLVGGCKPLLDVLQPQSRRHKVGLGVIVDDAPGCLTVTYVSAKPARGEAPRTEITIEPLAE